MKGSILSQQLELISGEINLTKRKVLHDHDGLFQLHSGISTISAVIPVNRGVPTMQHIPT